MCDAACQLNFVHLRERLISQTMDMSSSSTCTRSHTLPKRTADARCASHLGHGRPCAGFARPAQLHERRDLPIDGKSYRWPLPCQNLVPDAAHWQTIKWHLWHGHLCGQKAREIVGSCTWRAVISQSRIPNEYTSLCMRAASPRSTSGAMYLKEKAASDVRKRMGGLMGACVGMGG